MAKRTAIRWKPNGKSVWYEKVPAKNNGDNYVLKVYDSDEGGTFLGNYKSEDEILNDLKDDSIFENVEFVESFILDPLIITESLDPYAFFKEDYFAEAESFISSISKPTEKKNIGMKILELIKKFFILLDRAVQAVIKFIKSLFKRKAKSVDQVLKKLGAKQSKVSSDEWEDVEIPWADDSEMEIERKCSLAVKPMEIQMEANGTMVISTKDVVASAWFRHKQGKIKGNEGSFVQAYLAKAHIAAFKAIESPQIQEDLRTVADGIGNQKDADWKKINDIAEGIGNLIQNNPHEDFRVTLKQITDFGRTIDYCMRRVTGVIDNPEHSVDTFWATTHSLELNTFSKVLAGLQFGLNTITACLKDIYIIDAGYKECIDNPEVLSVFVGQMIAAGIPSKYVAMNTWLVSTKDIKGGADAFKPVWGQSRVVFFPPQKDYVHKVAVNGYGVRSNISESNVYKQLKNTKAEPMLAKVEWISKNGAVLNMEKITGSQPTMPEVLEFRLKLNNAIYDTGSTISIDDLHQNNVIRTKNGLVTIDYGMFNR